MIHMKYVGPLAALRGKTALVRSCAHDQESNGPQIQAQFDDLSLIIDGVRMFTDWHQFPRDHFADVDA